MSDYCVYLIAVERFFDGPRYAFYVGRTNNLERRISNHRYGILKEAVEHNLDYVCHVIEDSLTLDEASYLESLCFHNLASLVPSGYLVNVLSPPCPDFLDSPRSVELHRLGYSLAGLTRLYGIDT